MFSRVKKNRFPRGDFRLRPVPNVGIRPGGEWMLKLIAYPPDFARQGAKTHVQRSFDAGQQAQDCEWPLKLASGKIRR